VIVEMLMKASKQLKRNKVGDQLQAEQALVVSVQLAKK